MIGIRQTTINWTHCSALRFFVKSYALCTFIWYYIVYFLVNRGVVFQGINSSPISQCVFTADGGAISHTPFYTWFINRIIGTFGFTGATIDTFIRYIYGHNLSQVFVVFLGEN